MEKPKAVLTVLTFTGSNISESELLLYTDYITGYIAETNIFRVIDRSQREILLKEIVFSLGGAVDEDYQLEVGRLLSASYIVVGSLGKISETYIVNLKLVEVETGETLKTVSHRDPVLNNLVEQARFLAYSLIDYKPAKSIKDIFRNLRSTGSFSGTNQTSSQEGYEKDQKNISFFIGPAFLFSGLEYQWENMISHGSAERSEFYLGSLASLDYDIYKNISLGLWFDLLVGKKNFQKGTYYKAEDRWETLYDRDFAVILGTGINTSFKLSPVFSTKAYFGIHLWNGEKVSFTAGIGTSIKNCFLTYSPISSIYPKVETTGAFGEKKYNHLFTGGYIFRF